MRGTRMLIAVFLLLVWPALARAECAWLLWWRDGATATDARGARTVRWEPWRLYATFETRPACNERRNSALTMIPQIKTLRAKQAGIRHLDRAEVSLCVPDTVRPQDLR